MTQTAIPYLFMRGGTSRGPYFNRADLPEDLDDLARVLIAVVGSGHPLNIDGIGGGSAVTTKVAMLSKSDNDWADIDYFFAHVGRGWFADFKPTCGNIRQVLARRRLNWVISCANGRNRNQNSRGEHRCTDCHARSNRRSSPIYDGDFAVDGVPHRRARIVGFHVRRDRPRAHSPTRNIIDTIDGIDVTCMDVAMPMVIARAADFGLTGHETREELDANRAFFDRIEAIRIQAGALMGMGDVTKSVTPKFGLVMLAEIGWHIGGTLFHAMDNPPNGCRNGQSMFGVLRANSWFGCRWVGNTTCKRSVNRDLGTSDGTVGRLRL